MQCFEGVITRQIALLLFIASTAYSQLEDEATTEATNLELETEPLSLNSSCLEKSGTLGTMGAVLGTEIMFGPVNFTLQNFNFAKLTIPKFTFKIMIAEYKDAKDWVELLEPKVVLECVFDYYVPTVAGAPVPENLCFGHWVILNRRYVLNLILGAAGMTGHIECYLSDVSAEDIGRYQLEIMMKDQSVTCPKTELYLMKAASGKRYEVANTGMIVGITLGVTGVIVAGAIFSMWMNSRRESNRVARRNSTAWRKLSQFTQMRSQAPLAALYSQASHYSQIPVVVNRYRFDDAVKWIIYKERYREALRKLTKADSDKRDGWRILRLAILGLRKLE